MSMPWCEHPRRPEVDAGEGVRTEGDGRKYWECGACTGVFRWEPTAMMWLRVDKRDEGRSDTTVG
jgi:hypothetical protein